MKSDIEIAQEAAMIPVKEVAARYGIKEDDLELYGKYKAKLTDELWNQIKDRPDGKLVLVTAINPTPAGEGKTTVTVGLGEAFGRMGKNSIIALREPSLGPCFGIKGGAAGGGYAQVVPMEDLNLHLQVISMPLPLPITFWQLFLITISSREIPSALIQDRFYGSGAKI